MGAAGFSWPATDVFGVGSAIEAASDLVEAYAYVSRYGEAICTVGDCGVSAVLLSAEFRRVEAYEPDPENYRALLKNSTENVMPYCAGLSGKSGTGHLVRDDPDNCRSNRIIMSGSKVEVFTLDSRSSRPDLIVIGETNQDALTGATRTLSENRPVLFCFGKPEPTLEPWLETVGYRIVQRTDSGFICTHSAD